MKQRYFWIDNIRAVAMISMIIYHGVWDLVYLYGMNFRVLHFLGKLDSPISSRELTCIQQRLTYPNHMHLIIIVPFPYIHVQLPNHKFLHLYLQNIPGLSLSLAN